MFAELRKAGQSLLGVDQQQQQRRQQQQQQRSPSEEDDIEAGEIPEGGANDDHDYDRRAGYDGAVNGGGSSGHKRRLSPSGSDEGSQQRRSGGLRRTPPTRVAQQQQQPQSILDRVIEDVQSMKQLQSEIEEVDPDAPAAYKSSPSASGVRAEDGRGWNICISRLLVPTIPYHPLST